MEGSGPLTSIAEMYADDAPAAVLTKSQREYVLGETDYTKNQARAVESRIRNRLQAALYDFALVWRVLPEEEVEKIRPESGELSFPTDALAAWLYRLQPENATVEADLIEEASPENRDRRAEWVEGDVSSGIRKVIEHHEQKAASVETSILVEREVSLDELAEGDLTELSRERLTTLLREEKISAEEYGEAIQARLSE